MTHGNLRTLDQLLSTSEKVGAVVSMDYDTCIVASNDFYSNHVNGIPKRCFLLAVPEDENAGGVILLSVKQVQSLESTRSLQSLREELASSSVAADVTTRKSLQVIGYNCSILGAFYEQDGGVKFGADVDRVLGFTSYTVLKPMGESLGLLASYSRNSFDNAAVLEVGHVRYSETELVPDKEAAVTIDMRDFIGKKTGVLGMSRSGKALHENTRVPVPVSEKFSTGWALNKELEVGDLVYSNEGLPVPIIAFTEWSEEALYHVHFSDGQTVVTSGNHLWLASKSTQRAKPKLDTYNGSKQERKRKSLEALDEIIAKFSAEDYIALRDLEAASGINADTLYNHAKTDGIAAHLTHRVWVGEGRARRKVKVYPARELLLASRKRLANKGGGNSLISEKIVSTKEMLDFGLRRKGSKGRLWAVQTGSMETTTPPVELSIDPYILGHWLGDGRSAQGYLGADSKPHPWSPIGESDYEVLSREVTNAGYTWHSIPSDKDAISVDGLSQLLKAEGLIRNKHIPMNYLRASYNQRLALLQGLMDSDGYADKRSGLGLGFSDERLSYQALELIRSLGFKAKIKKKKAGYPMPQGRVECKDTYSITFNTQTPCFRLPRKLARQKNFSDYAPSHQLYIDSIEIKGRGLVRCLTVDAPNSLHLVEGFIPTHNSNSIKIFVQQVFNYSMAQKKRIGQLVFDPQGEYANSNVQDKGALGALGTAHDVAIYKTTAIAESGDREKPLLLNFFEEANAGLVWDLMLAEVHSGVSSGANYIAPLLTLSMTPPERTAPKEERVRYGRRRLGMYALMFLARMEGPIKNFYLTLPKDLVMELEGTHEKAVKSPSNDGQLHITSVEAAYSIFDALLDRYEKGELGNDSWIKSFKDGEMGIFKDQVEAFRSGRRGVTSAFMRLKELHSTSSSGDVREEVWQDLTKGKLVIVDLSRGSSSATRAISELIVTALLGKASERFVTGKEMVPFQIVVEEAHNLFPRGGDDSDYTNPWVRVSKEAAKYDIGLMYATQEVSSVDAKILSNTSNWIISHLNSKAETAALAGYYGFADWADHLRSTETKGFTRMKTESSPFIIPVQIKLFTPRER